MIALDAALYGGDWPKASSDEVTRPYGTCAITGPKEDVSFIMRHLPDVDEGAITYSSKQATKCAVCGEHKHTPLRVDRMGGYVCLTCIDKELENPAAVPSGDAALMDVIEHTAKVIGRQLNLIAERAPGDFLDKRPVVLSLSMHKQRLEKALDAARNKQS